ncbi:hypothetical protein GCM10027164_33640 [Algoriphagus taiwanensis]
MGTFNPTGGKKVLVHYGRSRNQTWKLLSEIFNVNFDPSIPEIHEKMKMMGIACLDLIESVEVSPEFSHKITGESYSDSNLFNRLVKRNYKDIDDLNKFLDIHPDICVFSTWGKGPQNPEWRKLISQINKKIIPLVSPSLVAAVPKGKKKFEYMLEDWKAKINDCKRFNTSNSNLKSQSDKNPAPNSDMPNKNKIPPFLLSQLNELFNDEEIPTNRFEISTNELKNGRINFPKKLIDYDLLPDFNTTVKIIIGKEGDSAFTAKIIDSGGGNARINKSKLKDWYEEENLQNQEVFNLEIVSKTTFIIYK